VNSILTPRPDDRPPQREDWGTGVTISLIAHASLIGALVWGLHWRSSTTVEAASAELWAAVPEAAAPPPVEAPPPPPPAPPPPAPVVETPPAPPPPPIEAPRPPDIVTEQVKPRKPPPKPAPPPPPPAPAPKPVPPKPAPTPPPPPKDKLDAKALAKLHDENLRRMMGEIDAPATNVGRATRNAGPSASWAGRVAALINSHLVYAGSLDGLRPPDIAIRLGVDGTILSQRITASSGNTAYDEAVLRAVIGTHTLPRDTDGTLPPDVLLTFKP
jgi:colicin import membrane protein